MTTPKMFSASAIAFVLACGGGGSPASPGSDTGSDTSGSSGSGSGPGTTGDVADDTTSTNAIDETSSSGSASTSEVGDSSDTGEVRECSMDARCIELPGEPWQGPITVMGSSSPTGRPCEGAALQETVYDTLFAPPPECTCSCSMEGTPSCDATLRYYTDLLSCGDDPVGEWTITEDCNNAVAPTVAFGGWWEVPFVVQNGAICAPNATTTVQEAHFDDTYELCEMPVIGMCGEVSACIEDQLGGICVWREGDFPCPGAFIARQVRYRGIVDDRACSECGCPSIAYGCDGVVQLFATNDCPAAGVYGELGSGTCEASTFSGFADPSARSVFAVPPGLSCDDAQGGEPYGTAGFIDPVTICCQ